MWMLPYVKKTVNKKLFFVKIIHKFVVWYHELGFIVCIYAVSDQAMEIQIWFDSTMNALNSNS